MGDGDEALSPLPGGLALGVELAVLGAIKAHMQHGTTSIFPTLSSSTIPMIRAAAETTEKMMAEPDYQEICTVLALGIISYR